MQPDVKALVAGLTETQRDALCFWPRGHWSAVTRRALRSKGLVNTDARTPLGEMVLQAIRGA